MAMTTPAVVHHPFVVHLGNVVTTGYGIAIVLAFVIAWVVIAHHNRYRGENVDFAAEIVLAASIGGLLGAKLSYAAVVGGPLIAAAGHTFWGGLLGGTCAYWVWTRLRGVTFARFLDPIGVSIAAGYAVGRTGCWAVGDDYGRAWNGPLAVRFPEGLPPSTAANMLREYGEPLPVGASPDTVLTVHPTQLYETALGFAMFFVLWRLRDHHHAAGWLFGAYCLIAGLERFAIDFIRVSAEHLAIGLSAAQVIALALVGAGAVIMVLRRTRGQAN